MTKNAKTVPPEGDIKIAWDPHHPKGYARIVRLAADMDPDHWVDYDPATNVCRINVHRYEEAHPDDQRTMWNAYASLWEDKSGNVVNRR